MALNLILKSLLEPEILVQRGKQKAQRLCDAHIPLLAVEWGLFSFLESVKTFLISLAMVFYNV